MSGSASSFHQTKPEVRPNATAIGVNAAIDAAKQFGTFRCAVNGGQIAAAVARMWRAKANRTELLRQRLIILRDTGIRPAFPDIVNSLRGVVIAQKRC